MAYDLFANTERANRWQNLAHSSNPDAIISQKFDPTGCFQDTTLYVRSVIRWARRCSIIGIPSNP